MTAQECPRPAWELALRRLPAALALLCALLLPGCSTAPDEQALRAILETMQQATEQRDSDAFLAGVADDFAGPQGLDRAGLRRLLALQFLRNQSIGATLTPPTVLIDGERAEVRFKAVVTGGSGWIPERASGYEVLTVWRRDRSEWLLEYAEWE